MRTLLLYFVTAMAEIVGCYLRWLWLKKGARFGYFCLRR